ncbi:uncharacterized protein H6S33_001986 [Morchella sextelata]|uniref:uncharacterized protein n=1 Tax=Morchella sextelata TaxID=1174677 RepID=UPI001D0481C4|nr:uncharacterized protein H6S33_001986 [Morchella sextelata]KAH0607934.1 hypothetical protein H6S33_001986 [Morchella sextelata]
MCGRYALAYPPADLAQRLVENGLPVDEEPLAREVRSGYNVAPGSHQPVYRALPAGGGAGAGEKEGTGEGTGAGGGTRFGLTAMRWGLIPSWSWPSTTTSTTPTPPPTTLTTINCRDTSLRHSTGLWSTLKHTQRCIIPAQGFYEWHKTASQQRIPHFIKRRDGGLLFFAGLWESHTPASGAPYYSYTIVTTAAAPAMRFVHERMPVVVEAGSEEMRLWLAPGVRWGERLQGVCVPWGGELEVYRVAMEVGNVKRDESWFVQPIGALKGGIESFFGGAGKGEKREADEGGAAAGGGLIAGDKVKADTKVDSKTGREAGTEKAHPKTEPPIDDEWETWPEAFKAAHNPEEEWETWPEEEFKDEASSANDPPEVKPEPASGTPENNAPNTTTTTTTAALKREYDDAGDTSSPLPGPPAKVSKTGETPWVRSATSNAANRRGGGAGAGKKMGKGVKDGTPMITNFFKK